jgi:heme-degrading monooxygenase HmoA
VNNAPRFIPPYFAVVFTSQRTEAAETDGYEETARRMVELAPLEPGFLGMESVRDAQGFGITVSYWRTEADVLAWRDHWEHTEARVTGRKMWYESYALRVCRVEREHVWSREP